MKRTTLLSISLFLIFSQVIFSQNSIKLYKITLKANEILGNGRSWGPKAGDNKTEEFTRAANDLNELLGQIYKTSNVYSVNHFLDTRIDAVSPILDSINYSYYDNYAFLKLEEVDPKLLKDANYIKFKSTFKSLIINNKERRVLLDKNVNYRALLEQSRYTTYNPKISITNITTINNQFKVGMSAEIVADIEKVFKLKPSLKIAISDSIQKHIEMKGAFYHEIQLEDLYIKRASMILKSYKMNDAALILAASKEDFADNFQTFLASCNSAIISGAAVLEASFSAHKIANLNAAIGLAVDFNLDTKPEEKKQIAELAANVTAKYVDSKSVDQTVSTFKTYYYLRYVFDSRLELGNCAKTKEKKQKHGTQEQQVTK